MLLDCGCAKECCGVCVLAASAGRPRLTSSNAASWPKVELLQFRGAPKREQRNAENGTPMLWFWQVLGTRWQVGPGDAARFRVAQKQWDRLVATPLQRAEETSKRHARAREQLTRKRDEVNAIQIRQQIEERLEQERAAKAEELAKQARKWRELGEVFAACGLKGLDTDVTRQIFDQQSILVTLYEPPSLLAKHTYRGRHHQDLPSRSAFKTSLQIRQNLHRPAHYRRASQQQSGNNGSKRIFAHGGNGTRVPIKWYETDTQCSALSTDSSQAMSQISARTGIQRSATAATPRSLPSLRRLAHGWMVASKSRARHHRCHQLSRRTRQASVLVTPLAAPWWVVTLGMPTRQSTAST